MADHEVMRQQPDGTWAPAEPIPAPWLVRVRTGQPNGRVQAVITAVAVLGVLRLVHLGADLARARQRRQQRR